MNGPGVSSCSCEGVGLVSKSRDIAVSFDDELERLFELSQRPFFGWSYSQRFKALPTIELRNEVKNRELVSNLGRSRIGRADGRPPET